MKVDYINYGISLDYINNWGYSESLREIVQNFIDYGDYDEEHNESDTFEQYSCDRIRSFSSDFSPSDLSWLAVGNSQKNGNTNAIGKHGEGIKMAMLVLYRLNMFVNIEINTPEYCVELLPSTYEDEHLGKCFAIKVVEKDVYNPQLPAFTVNIESNEEVEEATDKIILDPDTEIIFEGSYGDIIDSTPGDIYVGGLFVINYEDIPRAYNLKAENCDLGRDRNFPNFDEVFQSCGDIFQEMTLENNELPEEFSSKETEYINELPESYLETVNPVIIDNKVIYKDSKGITPENFAYIIKRNPVIAEKTVQLRYDLVKKEHPFDLIRSFNSKFKYCFEYNNEAKTAMNVILKSIESFK